MKKPAAAHGKLPAESAVSPEVAKSAPAGMARTAREIPVVDNDRDGVSSAPVNDAA